MLKFIILTGPLQGEETSVFEGQRIGAGESYDLSLETSLLKEAHLHVKSTGSGELILCVSSKESIIDFGAEKVSEVTLMPGLMFSIGDVGFSVQEQDAETNQSPFHLDSILDINLKPNQRVFPLKNPITLKFVRGSLLNTSMIIPWSPFSLGMESTLYHFMDDSLNISDDLMIFKKESSSTKEEIILNPKVSNIISVNQNLISKPTTVHIGDFVEFSNTAFYIEFP